jgi:CheY-like chemotaxis protein
MRCCSFWDFGGVGRSSSKAGRPQNRGQALAPVGTLRPFDRYAFTPTERGCSHIMLFGKRERAIRRIAIIEDEPLVAFDNEHLLGDAGYEVVATIDNFADALRLLEGGQAAPDLILCDIQLRGEGDGIDVARVAAAHGVPVLFVSGNCPTEARTLAIGCLAKPYSDKMLKTALQAVDRMLRGQPMKRLPPGLSLYDPTPMSDQAVPGSIEPEATSTAST